MEYSILSNLNDEQKLPASIIDGAILVTAGAGSGKTRMLTHRIAHMVKEKGINFPSVSAAFTKDKVILSQLPNI